MDKERILNFTSMLDKLGENDTCDKFMEYVEDSKNPSMMTKVAALDVTLSKKISKIGIPSLHKEYNQITAGWVDRLRDNWNKMRGRQPSADDFVESEGIAPSQLWEAAKSIISDNMSNSVFELSQLGSDLNSQWRTVQVAHDNLKQMVNHIAEQYGNIKNRALSEIPEQYRRDISNTYFSSLDSNVRDLNKSIMEDNPSKTLSQINNFVNKFKELITPSVGDEDVSYSLPEAEREWLSDAYDRYQNFNSEDRRAYMEWLRSEDPTMFDQLSNWIRNYG